MQPGVELTWVKITQYCKFYPLGHCDRGEYCTFAHEEADLDKYRPKAEHVVAECWNVKNYGWCDKFGTGGCRWYHPPGIEWDKPEEYRVKIAPPVPPMPTRAAPGGEPAEAPKSPPAEEPKSPPAKGPKPAPPLPPLAVPKLFKAPPQLSPLSWLGPEPEEPKSTPGRWRRGRRTAEDL